MYVKISGSDTYVNNGKSLPSLPFVVDIHGKPFDELNDYILYLAGTADKDLDSTVRLAVVRILVVLNRLAAHDSDFNWRQITGSRLELFMNTMKLEGHTKKKIQRETINGYVSALVGFLWWAEKMGFCSGVVGVNDIGVSDRLYSVALEPSSQKGLEYRIPFALSKDKTKRNQNRGEGSKAKWDRALEQVTQFDASGLSDRSIAIFHRDEIMLRLFLESSLRRIEVIHLDAGLFSSPLLPGERKKIISLPKTKFYETRDVGIHSVLYEDIQTYIGSSRKEIVFGKVKSSALIPSFKTGGFFKPNSITNLCKVYGVTPHDGRAQGLTEQFMDLIEQGVAQTTAILTVSQEAGHKIERRNAGDIFLRYYLRAENILSRANKARDSHLDLVEENVALKQSLVKANAELKRLGGDMVDVS